MSLALRRIALLGFDDVNALDLIGPSEVFSAANAELAARGQGAAYAISILAAEKTSFTAESGIPFLPHATLRDTAPIDTLIVPGGAGLREPATNRRMAAWLRARESGVRRVASVCTGIYGLAASGLLDGRRATTHWKHLDDAARRFPRVRFDIDAIFVRDGKFYTSAGLTAGIDLALALVEADHGAAIALAAARELVVFLKRDGGQAQYSEPLRSQTRGGDRFANLIAWMTSHLHEDLSVEVLAARVHLGSRHFSRLFRATIGASPADYVESLRLDAAMQRLASSQQSIRSIASSVGYHSDDAFRRVFERRLGVAPLIWRHRFSTTQSSSRHAHEPPARA